MTTVVDEVAALFKAEDTYGEVVTIPEHMLLTASAAEAEGASDELIAACLLHDVGHLIVEPDDEYGKHTHDEMGSNWVSERFPEAVSEPVRLHVAAKRYLCAIDPAYREQLSPASQYSLERQGGPMSPTEAATFEAQPHHEAAVRLRRLEDRHGKTTKRSVPSLTHFAELLVRVAT